MQGFLQAELVELTFPFAVQDMGGCQNYCPFWGTLNIRGRTILGIQKGTLILTTTQIRLKMYGFGGGSGVKDLVSPAVPNLGILVIRV